MQKVWTDQLYITRLRAGDTLLVAFVALNASAQQLIAAATHDSNRFRYSTAFEDAVDVFVKTIEALPESERRAALIEALLQARSLSLRATWDTANKRKLGKAMEAARNCLVNLRVGGHLEDAHEANMASAYAAKKAYRTLQQTLREQLQLIGAREQGATFVHTQRVVTTLDLILQLKQPRGRRVFIWHGMEQIMNGSLAGTQHVASAGQ